MTPNAQRPVLARIRFRLIPFRSPLLGESISLSVPMGTEMFQFPTFASPAYVFSRRCRVFSPGGLPHSDISGSTLFGSSPELFAAYTSFIASWRQGIRHAPLVA